MNTPITDAAANDSIVKVYETSKRLELDRAALMEALLACVAWTYRVVDLEVSGSMQIAQKASIEIAESVLAAARANFPTE